VKNTFLSFDEEGSISSQVLPQNTRKYASPRSRSAECSSPNRQPEEEGDPVQIHKLNRLLDDDKEVRKECLSPVQSPSLQPAPVPDFQPGLVEADRIASYCSLQGLGDCRSGRSSPPPGAAASPGSYPFGSAGPSAQELKQLKQRLQEVCLPRSRGGSQDFSPGMVPRVMSNGSVCSMAGTEASDLDGSQVRQVSLMRHVASNGSVSSMASFNQSEPMHELRASRCGSYGSISNMVEDKGDDEPVEFDLTIEESTEVRTWNDPEPEPQPQPCNDVEKWEPHRRKSKRSSPQASPGRSQASPARSSRQSASPRVPGPQIQDTSGPWQPGPVALDAAKLQRDSPSASPPLSPKSSPTSPKSPKQAGKQEFCPPPRKHSGDIDTSGSVRPLPKEYRHGHVPKTVNLEEEYKSGLSVDITTLMIRNIPNRYTQRELICELDDLGFAGTFDFLYIPLDKVTMSNVGYAFVNFTTKEWAKRCMDSFQNYRFKRHRKTSGKIAAVSVAHLQGLEANLAHYEKSAVNTAKLKQRRPVVMANISSSLSLSMALGEDDD